MRLYLGSKCARKTHFLSLFLTLEYPLKAIVFLSCLMGKLCMGSYVVLHFSVETSNSGKAVKRENKNHQRIGK